MNKKTALILLIPSVILALVLVGCSAYHSARVAGVAMLGIWLGATISGLLAAATMPSGDATVTLTGPYAALDADDKPKYPCAKCGMLRSKRQGGTTFTHCDDCWNPKPPLEGDTARRFDIANLKVTQAIRDNTLVEPGVAEDLDLRPPVWQSAIMLAQKGLLPVDWKLQPGYLRALQVWSDEFKDRVSRSHA